IGVLWDRPVIEVGRGSELGPRSSAWRSRGRSPAPWCGSRLVAAWSTARPPIGSSRRCNPGACSWLCRRGVQQLLRVGAYRSLDCVLDGVADFAEPGLIHVLE